MHMLLKMHLVASLARVKQPGREYVHLLHFCNPDHGRADLGDFLRWLYDDCLLICGHPDELQQRGQIYGRVWSTYLHYIAAVYFRDLDLNDPQEQRRLVAELKCRQESNGEPRRCVFWSSGPHVPIGGILPECEPYIHQVGYDTALNTPEGMKNCTPEAHRRLWADMEQVYERHYATQPLTLRAFMRGEARDKGCVPV